MSKKLLTLCMVHTGSHLLLGYKKRGTGEGKWNGFGGKVEQGESIEDAARREVLEEAGIHVPTIENVGIIHFEFDGNPEIWEVHIFRTTEYTGEPAESEEMRPQWYAFDEIPFENMWQDDKYWIPFLLKGSKFKGKFNFDEKGNLLSGGVDEIADF